MSIDSARWTNETPGSMRSLRDTIVHGAAIILLFGVVAVLLAIAYLVLVPARYDAVTELLLDPRRLQVVSNELTPRPDTNDSAVSMVESQVRVMQSEAVLRAVIERLHLDEDQEFVGSKMLDRIIGLFSSGGPPEGPATTALRALQRMVVIERASRSYVVSIRARSEDPFKAARIADAIANVYLDQDIRARADAANRVGTMMTARLQELADRLRDSERRVEDFKRDNDLVGAGRRLVSDQQLEELNSRLGAARAHTAEQKARLDQIERILASGANPDSIPEAIQSQTITALRAQYADVLRNEGTTTAVLGARHPDARIIHEQVRQYRRLITDELQRIAAAARSDYERAKFSEEQLAANLDTLKRTAVQSNEAMVRMRELERVADSNRTIYEAFLVRAKELGEQGGVDTSNTRVIAVAVPPNRPTTPRGTLVLLALLAGLVLGTVLVVVRARPRPAK